MTPPAVLATAAAATREMRLPALLAGLGLVESLAQPLPEHHLILAGIADLPDTTPEATP